jgi:thiamine transporter ThiT
LDGWGFIYYPFDYFVAYGCSLAVASLFAKFISRKVDGKLSYLVNNGFMALGVLLAGIVRVIGHTISSMVFYEYTLDASLAYNIPYVVPSILLCLVVLFMLYPTLIVLNRMYPTSFLKKINA